MKSSRFGSTGGDEARRFTASISFDRRLWGEDLAVNRAHARMLARQGILAPDELEAILGGLEQVEREIESGTFPYRERHEDIHLNIEARLTEIIGPLGGKLHTARSRNDQVATDFHLYVVRQCSELSAGVARLQRSLLDQARAHDGAILPGLTHLQRAQPVLLAHHLLAYFWMFERDKGRFADCAARARLSPLGACALAGTSFPIDPAATAAELGLGKPYPNSMDAVSDRDFAVEFLAAASICQMHLSRLAEELILWCSTEFGYAEPDDAHATGSSIMPQKKNPDVAELVRGKTGRVYGHLLSLLTVLKGLPLAYHTDLQEDKEAVFSAADTLAACLTALAGMVAGLRYNVRRMAAAAERDFAGATDLADWLAKRGVPFREAHNAVGGLVRGAIERGIGLCDLSSEDLVQAHPAFAALEGLAWLRPEALVAARNSYGGTAPGRVAEQLAEAERLLAEESAGAGRLPAEGAGVTP